MAMSVFISACGSGGGSSSGGGGGSTPATLGTPGSYNCIPGSITVAGSTALQPLVQAVAKDYSAKCSGATITVNGGGSGTGLTSAENSTAAIGNSDIFSKKGQEDLVDHQVAIVVFALILNSKVTGVTSLTTDQIKGIYTGATKNWKEVGGPNLPIVVVSRPTSSGTRATFQKFVLNAVESIKGPSSLTTDSTGTVINNVKSNDGAIGYAALGPAKNAGATIVNIDGNAPDPTLVESNTYKFWNIEHMYTKGKATGLAQALIDYLYSDQGKQEGQKLDFIAISDMKPDALQSHQPTA
jgi:phosphate transport system substrate-binding protein